jgi:hypothetical protein
MSIKGGIMSKIKMLIILSLLVLLPIDLYAQNYVLTNVVQGQEIAPVNYYEKNQPLVNVPVANPNAINQSDSEKNVYDYHWNY